MTTVKSHQCHLRGDPLVLRLKAQPHSVLTYWRLGTSLTVSTCEVVDPH